MPKRQNRPRTKRRQSLYLVFDDWCYGYSIRKVNTSPKSRRNLQTALSGKSAVQRLPRPFFRLEASHGWPKYFVSAFGSKILAMHTKGPDDDTYLSGSFITMLDVRSRAVSFGPPQDYPLCPLYLPVGNKLFSLSEGTFEMLSLEMLRPPPLGEPRSIDWSWQELSEPPFEVYAVTSYAVHPDDQTFIISTELDGTAATFTFDAKNLKWELLGNWVMPFAGCGHFDPHLDAFVGLSKDPDTLGHLCCHRHCSFTGDGQWEWKLSKEKLFSVDPAERHVGATLVYMGCPSKFCLVQCVSILDDSADQELIKADVPILDDSTDQELIKEADVPILDDTADQELIKEAEVRRPGSCLYRLTSFSLSLDMNGDLTTAESHRVQYYEVPKATTKSFLVENPVAFGL